MRTLIIIMLFVGTAQAEPQWTVSLHTNAHASVQRVEHEIAAARAARKPIMIDLFAQWCAACRVLDRALSSPDLRRELGRFITVRIEVTDQEDLGEIETRFASHALPTVQLISSRGTVTQLVGTRTRAELTDLLRAVR